jgi:hypothetical protein
MNLKHEENSLNDLGALEMQAGIPEISVWDSYDILRYIKLSVRKHGPLTTLQRLS